MVAIVVTDRYYGACVSECLRVSVCVCACESESLCVCVCVRECESEG